LFAQLKFPSSYFFAESEDLRVTFTCIDPEDPLREFSFLLEINSVQQYQGSITALFLSLL
jgi:hypothetical protein